MRVGRVYRVTHVTDVVRIDSIGRGPVHAGRHDVTRDLHADTQVEEGDVQSVVRRFPDVVWRDHNLFHLRDNNGGQARGVIVDIHTGWFA